MSDRPKTPENFVAHLAQVATAVGERELGPDLEEWLNAQFPAGGPWYQTAHEKCHQGVVEGWLCAWEEPGGIKYGRAVKPCDALSGMSIDVVEMSDVVGPHHSHPNGEIDLVMPIDPDARFDGRGAGWKVYGPGSAHRPTVRGGKALVLYLLPGGAIDFTKA